MKLFVLQVVILGLATAVLADNLQYFSITTNQAAEVKRKLEARENGTLNAGSTNENVLAEQCRELIGYYLLHTNDISTKAKLPISRCYAEFGMLTNASNLAEEYAKVYSNDFQAWELLGEYYDKMNLPNEAIHAFSSAVELGDNDSYEALAGTALKSGRSDVVKGIVPQLLALKDAKQNPEENKLHIISLLIVYSMMADRKDVFIKTLEGEDMRTILKNNAVKKNITSGCAYFEDEDTTKEIAKIRQKMESVIGSTNSVSSPPR